MEALSQSLQPYKEIIGNLASVFTIAQFFSGSFICLKIHKQNSTQDISSVPFIGGVSLGILLLKYALMLGDKAMFQVNVAAVVINFVYIVIFHAYSMDRWEEVYRPSSIGVAVVAGLFGYTQVEDPALLEFRYGLILTVLMLILMGSPLFELRDIIENEDASAIPFPLVLSGSVVSLLWLLYGIILNNEFMVFQNFIGLILCLVQLTLTFMYPCGDKED